MNRTVKILAFVSIMAGFAGCVRDVRENPEPSLPQGYVRASLELQVEKPDQIQTRATQTEEDAYDDSKVWVLLFNATSASDATPTTLVQAPVKAIKTGTKLYVLLRATTQPVTLFMVTGLSPALNGYLETVSNFSEGSTTFAAVNDRLQTAAVTQTGVPIGSGSYFHMSSKPVFYSAGTIPVVSITQQLIRNVAKINVDASAVSSDFTLESATLVNGAQKGFVLQQAAIPANNGGDPVRYLAKSAVVGNKLMSEIYMYENSGFLSGGTTPNPTKLIVKGKYKGGASGYYRMDILENNGDGSYTPYDIKRNCSYTLKIGKIENGGYTTFDEAISGEPSNTWYDVVVKDPDSYDIASNGHYYLGVSNSELIVYGDPAQTGHLHVATVTTDAPTGTYTSISSSADLSAVTSTLTTPVTGTATATDIYATIGSATSGYIDLRVGNLTKRITVVRESSIFYGNGEKTDFADQRYVAGEVVSGTEWVRLAEASNADFDLSMTSLVDPNGGLYVRYNSTLTLNPSRSAELYATKTNDQGRTKMLMFASAITYESDALPSNIDKDGKDINGVDVFGATFSNPGGYPFAVGITLASDYTPLTETASDAAAVKSIDLAGVRVTDPSVILPRGLSLKYKVNGIWLDTGVNLQQRTFFSVRILSAGGSAICIDNGTVSYGTKLGSANPGNTYTATLGKMLHLYTGSGKPIENKFELFNLSDGPTSGNGPSLYNNIGQTLRNNNIDILFVSINNGNFNGGVGPDAAQTREILDWLDENPYRGMIFITDYGDNAEITKALFGETQISSSGIDPYSKLPSSDPYYDNPVYKAIMCGSYSTTYPVAGNPIDLRETQFANAPGGNNAYGGVPLAKTNAAGFIPIFYVTVGGTQYVLFTVHPSKNIVMMGDINWFTASSLPGAFLNSDGSLAPASCGNYPKLVMNIWEWYINSVALGRN